MFDDPLKPGQPSKSSRSGPVRTESCEGLGVRIVTVPFFWDGGQVGMLEHHCMLPKVAHHDSSHGYCERLVTMIRERDSDVVTGRPGGDGLGEDRDAARAGVRESLCLKLMSARQASDALDSSQPDSQAREHFPDHSNTSIPPSHDDNTTTTPCTAAPYSRIQPNSQTTLLTGLCRKSKAGEASTRE